MISLRFKRVGLSDNYKLAGMSNACVVSFRESDLRIGDIITEDLLQDIIDSKQWKINVS